MDKVKVIEEIAEVSEVTKELVANGFLDGDQAEQVLFDFVESTLRKQFEGNAEVG